MLQSLQEPSKLERVKESALRGDISQSLSLRRLAVRSCSA